MRRYIFIGQSGSVTKKLTLLLTRTSCIRHSVPSRDPDLRHLLWSHQASLEDRRRCPLAGGDHLLLPLGLHPLTGLFFYWTPPPSRAVSNPPYSPVSNPPYSYPLSTEKPFFSRKSVSTLWELNSLQPSSGLLHSSTPKATRSSLLVSIAAYNQGLIDSTRSL